MCLIIVKQKNNRLPAGVSKTAGFINPHGLGVVWLDTFEITYHKSSEYSVLETDRPFIAHFRYATVGKIGLDNTHPFRCGVQKHEYLMMNGTIQGLGCKDHCDTKVLAQGLGSVQRHLWKQELAKHDVRFVSINVRNRTFQIYNRHLFTYKDGIWYSKDNVLQDNLVAVYGTLKKGKHNYYSYLTSSKHVGAGKTKDKYPLLVQGIPYMVDKKGTGHNVVVDIFKVSDSTLMHLDKLEGHPKWYERKQIPIKLDKSGSELMCWVYFNPKDIKPTDVLHETYEPQQAKYGYNKYGFSNFEQASWKTMPYEYDEFEDAIEEDFNIENEIPLCIDCYNDLEHDGFSNYHCQSCGAWFKESEVAVFNP